MSLNLFEMVNGAVQEQINLNFQEVINNIADPNTSSIAKRELNIKLTFKPNDDREESNIDIQCKTKLAPVKSLGTKIYIGQDNDGNVVAEEFIKGQLFGQTQIDYDTGEVIESQKLKAVK